jgi:hypothetical protein
VALLDGVYRWEGGAGFGNDYRYLIKTVASGQMMKGEFLFPRDGNNLS